MASGHVDLGQTAYEKLQGEHTRGRYVGRGCKHLHVAALSFTGFSVAMGAMCMWGKGGSRATNLRDAHKSSELPPFSTSNLQSVHESSELIAYGFKPDARSPNFVSSTSKLFDFQHGDTEKVAMQNAMTTFVSHDQMAATSEDLASQMNLQGTGCFSGSLASATTVTSHSHFHQMVAIFQGRAQQAQITTNLADASDFADRLRPSFKDVINTRSPAKIVEDMGEFYATRLALGGVIRTVFQQTEGRTHDFMSFSANVHRNATALTAGAASSGGFQTHASMTSSSSDLQISTTVQGGQVSLWLSGGEDYHTIQEAWSRSLTDYNQFPISMALTPIWELVKAVNSTKGMQVESYLKEQWRHGAEQLEALDSRHTQGCNPLQDRYFKMLVIGSDAEQLNRYLMYETPGGAMLANGTDEDTAAIIQFVKADGCDTYELQTLCAGCAGNNHWWKPNQHCDYWLYANYPRLDASPTKFIEQDTGKYKMQNVMKGDGGYFYTYSGHWEYDCFSGHTLGSVNADYDESNAMIVQLIEVARP